MESVTHKTTGVTARLQSVLGPLQEVGLVFVTFLSFFPHLFHLQEYLFFTLFTIVVISSWLQGKAIWVRSPVDFPLLLFLAWVLITIPFSIDPAYSFTEWRKLIAQVLVFYWVLLVVHQMGFRGVVLGFEQNMSADPRRTKKVISRVLLAVMIGTAIVCGYSLVEFFLSGGTWKERGIRAMAVNSSANWLGTYMVIVIPMLGVMMLTAVRWWKRILSGAVSILALLALVFSYMRASWLAVMVQCVSLGVVTRRPRLIFLALAGCTLGLVGVLALHKLGYHTMTVDTYTLDLRFSFWRLAIEVFLEHPLVGIGYGNYTFVKWFTECAATEVFCGIHSTFLMIAMGSGTPALVFFLWFLGKAVQSLLFRSEASNSEDEPDTLRIGVALMVVGFSIRNLFDYMFIGSLAYLFWILLAVGLFSKTERGKYLQRLDSTRVSSQ